MLVVFSLLFNMTFAKLPEVPEMDTMSVYHEQEHENEIIKKISFRSDDGRVNEEVVFINSQGEPYVEPIKIIVGYQVDGGEFKKVNRDFTGHGESNYCDFSEPEMMTREEYAALADIDLAKVKKGEALSVPGEYLVLPLNKFDPKSGECDYTRVYDEVISIEGQKNL